MNTPAIFLIFFLFPAVLPAQKFLPVIDSMAACSWSDPSYEFSENASAALKKLDIFHIVEQMPAPVLTGEEAANILNSKVSLSDDEIMLSGNIHIQCVVNCRGEAGDFQIMRSPDKLEDIANEVVDVFRERMTKWSPGKQKNRNVDVFVHILVKLEFGVFSVRGVV